MVCAHALKRPPGSTTKSPPRRTATPTLSRRTKPKSQNTTSNPVLFRQDNNTDFAPYDIAAADLVDIIFIHYFITHPAATPYKRTPLCLHVDPTSTVSYQILTPYDRFFSVTHPPHYPRNCACLSHAKSHFLRFSSLHFCVSSSWPFHDSSFLQYSIWRRGAIWKQ